MAGKKPKNRRRTHSKITGVKFNRQDRSVRAHGPLPKRQTYQIHIENVIKSDFLNEWRTSEEFAWEASKGIPKTWKQITPSVLGQIVRPMIADQTILRKKDTHNGQRVAFYRKSVGYRGKFIK